MLARSFVPRAPTARVVHQRYGWETSLTGWSQTSWQLVSTRWSSLTGEQKKALVTLARKVTKKAATLTVSLSPGQVVTGRPVGTRMGKGKGKPTGTRRWAPVGTTVFRVNTVQAACPSRLQLVTGRSSSALLLLRRFY